MAIQLPATRTTARWPSNRTKVACWDNNMRVEGSSRPVRICCQSSGRLAAAGAVSPTGTGVGSGVAGAAGLGAGLADGPVGEGLLVWGTGAVAEPPGAGSAGRA